MFILSSDYLKQEIILHLFGSGFVKWVYKPNGSIPFDCEPMNLLYFSQTRSVVGRFQSIRPVQKDMHDSNLKSQQDQNHPHLTRGQGDYNLLDRCSYMIT